jgi:hypothetical protein
MHKDGFESFIHHRARPKLLEFDAAVPESWLSPFRQIPVCRLETKDEMREVAWWISGRVASLYESLRPESM